jgi:hypothetical protein
MTIDNTGLRSAASHNRAQESDAPLKGSALWRDLTLSCYPTLSPLFPWPPSRS